MIVANAAIPEVVTVAAQQHIVVFVALDRVATAGGRHHVRGLEPVDPSWRQAFEPGVVITLAPGLYDRNAGFGVRIEDLILITEEGAEVLTEGVPRERKEIETRIKERGVFDWMDDRRN